MRIHEWLRRLSVDALAVRLAGSGSGLHHSIDRPEGLVYRRARGHEVIAVAKWRPDKVDGCFLPEKTGQAASHHWIPS